MINHILNESGVTEKFCLIVTSGTYAGNYECVKPDGWDDITCRVDINETLFYVENFILGSEEKISFLEYNDIETTKLISNVYQEQGGDGQILFKWIAEKNGVEYDLLGENFEINLNKYKTSFAKSRLKIETEIKKRESQSKLLNREDTTVDLFTTKDLDDNDLVPISTVETGFKKGNRILKNFSFINFDEEKQSPNSLNNGNREINLPLMTVGDDHDMGYGWNDNLEYGIYKDKTRGYMLKTDITLTDVKIEISNLEAHMAYTNSANWATLPDVKLYYVISNVYNFGDIREMGVLISGIESTKPTNPTIKSKLFKIQNETFNIGSLKQNEMLNVFAIGGDNKEFQWFNVDSKLSITVTSNVESPIVKTKSVKIFDAINQLAKNYTNGQITLESNTLGQGGAYENTTISTGVYLRGLPTIYTIGQKIKTSLKSLLYDGSAPLLALGFDINNNKLIVEDLDYFFKDLLSYDLSSKTFLEDGFSIENDKEMSFNQVKFGTKKYSTDVKDDIKNFNTYFEASTPLITIKDKFDKTTELIIDENKIQELIEDDSTKTNDNDDDLVLIDMINVADYWDDGVFEDAIHEIDFDSGNLKITCLNTPFDTTFIKAGTLIEIKEGINNGTYNVISVDKATIMIDKTTGILTGEADTPIRYKIDTVFKNRTGAENEGFTNVANVRNKFSSTNLRHNPKFQMARWFRYFGGALSKKQSTETIKITNYKNNDKAQLQVNDSSMANELQGLITVGASEKLETLRSQYKTYFTGQKIEITICDVLFHEFLDLYNSWKFGISGDRTKSRGYLQIKTPKGIMQIFPFGNGAFEFDKSLNQLTIKGKIKEPTNQGRIFTNQFTNQFN